MTRRKKKNLIAVKATLLSQKMFRAVANIIVLKLTFIISNHKLYLVNNEKKNDNIKLNNFFYKRHSGPISS